MSQSVTNLSNTNVAPYLWGCNFIRLNTDVLTSEGPVIKTKIKANKKLTIAIWFQKFDRVACFGLGILQKC